MKLAPCLAAMAIVMQPGLARAETPVVKAVIDLSAGETLVEQISEFHSGLTTAGRVVYLDLTIKPGGSADSPDYRVTSTTSSGSQPAGCSEFGRLGDRFKSFSFGFNPDYNHLLLTLFAADRAAFPFLSITCEYDSSAADSFALVFRGYFAVNRASIPTADDIELRPVAPFIPL